MPWPPKQVSDRARWSQGLETHLTSVLPALLLSKKKVKKELSRRVTLVFLCTHVHTHIHTFKLLPLERNIAGA